MSGLVLRNARLAGQRARVNIVVVDGDIAAVCDDLDLRDATPPRAEIIDLAGRVVTAGLTDSHMHPVLGNSLTDGLDLSACTSLDQVRSALQHAPVGPTGWITGWGLDPNCFGGIPVTHQAVAEIIGHRPMLLRLFDGHSALASGEALHRAGITGPREFASRSHIVCDDTGRPTGLLLEEQAIAIVEHLIPTPSFAHRRTRLKYLLDAMAATGLAGGHVMDCDGDALDLYASLDDAGDLPLRLQIAPWRRPEDDDRRVAELLDLQTRRGRLWKVSGIKLFIDGTIDNGTAWLDQPDCHGESTTAYWRDPHDYTRAVHDLASHGIQTATHAIGDAAVAHVLTTMGHLPPGARRGHRIEHIETLPDHLLAAFVQHNVTASMQPSHASDYTRADHTDNWSRRLGHARANRAWRCRDLHDAGVLLTLGSDWPIAPFDPRAVMAAAQLRRPWNRPDLHPVAPSQALTAEQALAGYTTAPATASGNKKLGTIAVNHYADMTIWDHDPLNQKPDQLPHIPIAATIVNGQTRYRNTTLC